MFVQMHLFEVIMFVQMQLFEVIIFIRVHLFEVIMPNAWGSLFPFGDDYFHSRAPFRGDYARV